MKAVIPVAGAGIRLRPLTYTQPKPLLPVAGKPIISFIIDQLIEQDIREFVFVIGYLGEKIRNYIDQQYPDIERHYITQAERLGSGHAIWTARELFKDADEITISFGDIIIDVDFKAVMNNSSSVLCVKKVDAPREYGVVEYDRQGHVKRVVEKPKIPKSNMAMVGCYRIKEVHALIEALAFNIENNIRSNGEFPLTDGLMRMIEQGVPFASVAVDNWFNCGKKEVLLDTNAAFLNREGYASKDLPEYPNSIIIQPVSIGKNCQINNAIIGPHVTIGNHTQIEFAVLRDSIIGNYAHIKEVILQRSVVGNDTVITGLRQSLNIGDNTEIDFSLPR